MFDLLLDPAEVKAGRCADPGGPRATAGLRLLQRGRDGNVQETEGSKEEEDTEETAEGKQRYIRVGTWYTYVVYTHQSLDLKSSVCSLVFSSLSYT